MKASAWRWGAFPGEKCGLLHVLLRRALDAGDAHAAGTHAGRIFALREAQSVLTRGGVS